MITDITILLIQHRKSDRRRMSERREFVAACGLPEASFRYLDVHEQEPDMAGLAGIDAILIGGSAYSVFEDTPHQEAAIAVIREAARRGIPILGICFGAQLLAKAFGGTVIADDVAKEVGTFAMRRTEDGSIDALFADMPDKFPAQCAHRCRVSELPPGALVLAKSERCPVQAFVLPGRDIYAVQFHPEVTKDALLARIERDRQSKRPSPHDHAVCYAAIDPYDVEETPQALSLIRRFIDRIVLHRVKTVV